MRSPTPPRGPGSPRELDSSGSRSPERVTFAETDQVRRYSETDPVAEEPEDREETETPAWPPMKRRKRPFWRPRVAKGGGKKGPEKGAKGQGKQGKGKQKGKGKGKGKWQ